MSGSQLLETAKWRDVVELGLCMAIHDVCNDSQFENCTPLDFANFLNVREVTKSIAVLPKEKLRVCRLCHRGQPKLPQIHRRSHRGMAFKAENPVKIRLLPICNILRNFANALCD